MARIIYVLPTWYAPRMVILLICLKTLKFSHYINFKFRTDPHCKFKSDIFMCICTSISSGFSLKRYRISLRNKLFYTYLETIKPRVTFNYGEFAIIKIRIIDFFPYTNKLKSISRDSALDREALRVVGLFPDFIPAQHLGKKVNAWFTLPISFKFSDYADYCDWLWQKYSIINLNLKN